MNEQELNKWIEWHEREHAKHRAKYQERLKRIAERMENEARDYYINGNFLYYTPPKEIDG